MSLSKNIFVVSLLVFYIFQGSAFALNEEGSSASPVFSDEMKAQIEQNKILFEKSLQSKTSTITGAIIPTGTNEQDSQVQKTMEPLRRDINNNRTDTDNNIGLWIISIFNSVCLFFLLIAKKTPKK